MNKRKRIKRKKLGTKMLIGFGIFAVVVVLFTCAAIGAQYWNVKMREYNDLVFSYAKTAAEYIDGDMALQYVETGEKDDYYDSIQSFMSATQEQSGLLYYYVFVPYDNDLVYVWDAGDGEGARPLGYHEEYMVGGKEDVEKIFRTDPPEKISTYHDETYGYIASGYYPIFNSAGEPVACVGVDISMPDVIKALTGFIITIIFCVLIITVLAIFILYSIVRRSIVSPIKLLNDSTRSLVENLGSEDDFSVDIATGDEIEELAESFSRMNIEIKDYIARLSAVSAEKERIGAELDIARHIQSSMLPCVFPPFPERKEFDIYASMTPAKEVGGDFYDFFMVDDRRLAIVIADVSGKGVPAALFMVIAKTLIKDRTSPGADLGKVFTEVNNLLCESNSEGLFVTAFEGVLDLATGEFNFVNAGHEIPYIRKKGGGFEPYKIKAAFVLAGMEDMKYTAGSMTLDEGDKIFQYTDGVTEATNLHNEFYGSARLNNTLNVNADKSPREIIDAVKKDIDVFADKADRFDDITMLCLEFKRKMRPGAETAPYKEITVDATLDGVREITEAADAFLEENGCGIKAKTRIDIAIDEIAGNIANYAYANGGKMTARIEIDKIGKSAYLTFTDSGIPYNPLEAPNPNISLSAKERDAGGLGIFLVKKTMDEMKYEYKDGKNVLTVRKDI